MSKRNFSNRFLSSGKWPSGFSKIIPVNPEFRVKDIDVDDPTGLKRDLNGAYQGGACLRVPPGGSLQLRWVVLTFGVSDAGALGWSLRTGISNMFSGHADAAGAGATLDTFTMAG